MTIVSLVTSKNGSIGDLVVADARLTTGNTSAALTRRLDYETPTGTSGHGEATVKVNPSHKFRMRINGQGIYERPPEGMYGLAGYWSGYQPDADPKWVNETICA